MSQHTELIARLHGLTGTLKSGAWSTIAEAADALQALEPTLDAAAALGNLTTKREKVILLSRAQKENELLRAKIATQELRLEDANGLLRYVADQRDAALSKLQALERVPMTEWQPIDTAPKDGRTLLLGYFNSHKKWRTMRGQWFSQDVINEEWEEPDMAGEGWYETCVENDDMPNCWWTAPTHWHPLPTPPESKG